MTGFFDVFNWPDVAHVDSIASDARKMNRLWQQERQGQLLFEDTQSGEENADLRSVTAKCLRDQGQRILIGDLG